MKLTKANVFQLLKLTKQMISTVISLIFIVFLSSCDKNSSSFNKNPFSINGIITYIEKKEPSFAAINNKNRLIFLLDFNDFNCPPCFDDFISLCDQINNICSKDAQTHIAAVFRQGDIASFENPKKLLYWQELNNINFTTIIAADSVFESIGFSKSMAIIIDNNKEIILSEHFPMGVKKHNTIIQLIACNK